MKKSDLNQAPALEIIPIDENVITTSETPQPGDNDTDFEFGDW